MNVFADPRWSEALSHLPDYLGNHVRVSLAALALGLIVSLPLAILTRNRPAPRSILLAFASIVQTVPGLSWMFREMHLGIRRKQCPRSIRAMLVATACFCSRS